MDRADCSRYLYDCNARCAYIDLFCGAGGSSPGLETHGLKVVNAACNYIQPAVLIYFIAELLLIF